MTGTVSEEEIYRDLVEMSRLYGNLPLRIFLADGDALTVGTEYLGFLTLMLEEGAPMLEEVREGKLAGAVNPGENRPGHFRVFTLQTAFNG